jgi:mannose-6-phosphate isomerase-like protein (cupin superfamily)
MPSTRNQACENPALSATPESVGPRSWRLAQGSEQQLLGRLRARLGDGMLTDMTEAFIVVPGEGRRLDLGKFEAIVLATAAQTSNEFTLLQTQGEPTEFGPPMHIHRDAAEAFYVLEGDYLMYVDDRQRLCPPGTFVYVPRGVLHTFRVVSAGPGKKLNLFSPAAMVGFFEDLAAAESAGTATPELLDKIASRNHMDVIGPVPDTYL